MTRMKISSVATAFALALSACAPIGEDAVQTSAATTSFYCEDGSTVRASYPTTNTARVLIGDQAVDMTIAVAASGSRYVGSGWQWWTKGMNSGLLTRLAPGEDKASAKGTNCTAT